MISWLKKIITFCIIVYFYIIIYHVEPNSYLYKFIKKVFINNTFRFIVSCFIILNILGFISFIEISSILTYLIPASLFFIES